MSTPDAITVAARSVLLDVLVGLGIHRQAVVLVGAQVVYLRTDQRELTFAASATSDGDLALDPRFLADAPLLDDAMRSAGFAPRDTSRPGIWEKWVEIKGHQEAVTVDLLVPEALAGQGRRAAAVPVHGRKVATRAAGLEAALVDHGPLIVKALDASDRREIEVEVAGRCAHLVAKLHKLQERIDADKKERIRAKDAGDIYRLLLVLDIETESIVLRQLLSDDLCKEVTTTAMRYLKALFAVPAGRGIILAAQALAGDISPGTVRQVCTRVTHDLLRKVDT